MSIFDSTPEMESPEIGHEEISAEEEVQEQHEEIEQEEVHEEPEYEEVTDEEESDPDAGHSDDLLAGKYKSVDDLVKGYKELQRQFTQSRQQQPQQPQSTHTASHDDPVEVFWQEFQRDPFNTLRYLVSQEAERITAPIVERDQTQTLNANFEPIAKQYAQQLSADGGLDSYHTKIKEIAQEFGNPNLARNPSSRILRMAAEELWGDSKATIYQKAVQQTRQEMDANRRSKQGAAVQTSKKPSEPPKTEEDLIRESILKAGRTGGIF